MFAKFTYLGTQDVVYLFFTKQVKTVVVSNIGVGTKITIDSMFICVNEDIGYVMHALEGLVKELTETAD